VKRAKTRQSVNYEDYCLLECKALQSPELLPTLLRDELRVCVRVRVTTMNLISTCRLTTVYVIQVEHPVIF
jgi:hypothetical protein